MGKANKAKIDFRDVSEMTDVVQALKDIADNKYFTLINQKEKFRRFGETFVEFFRMLSLAKVKHPLINNDNFKTAIIVVTGEDRFLGEFNNKIIKEALKNYNVVKEVMQKERKEADVVEFISVGYRGEEILKQYTPEIKTFSQIEDTGYYEMAIMVKDYLIEEIMQGRLGKVVICYGWPKSFETQMPRIQKLLPCEDLLSKQAQFVDVFEKVIEESDPADVIGYLTNLWITTRLFEILVDTSIAAAAAQSQFLEESVDRMKKDRQKVRMKYMKAKKNDIDKGLRETFSARMMVTK